MTTFVSPSQVSAHRIRRLTCVLAALPLLGVASCSIFSSSVDTAVDRPFADDSYWNVKIPANPVLDKTSAAMVNELVGAPGIRGAAVYEFGIPIYQADENTPLVEITCAEQWGKCPFPAKVPIPAGARPAPGSDGAMVVVDASTDTAYEFWRAKQVDTGRWVTSWGAVTEHLSESDGQVRGHATASAMSRLGGVIREREIAAGHIDHALSASSILACRSRFRPPALKTDGTNTNPDCIPEGTRLQLDPSIDVDAIPGITDAERIVARALQTYGVYIVDTGGSALTLSFELPTGTDDAKKVPETYRSAGIAWDYFDFLHLPWSRMQVLENWRGTADAGAPR